MSEIIHMWRKTPHHRLLCRACGARCTHYTVGRFCKLRDVMHGKELVIVRESFFDVLVHRGCIHIDPDGFPYVVWNGEHVLLQVECDADRRCIFKEREL